MSDPLTDYLHAQASSPLGDKDMNKKPNPSTKTVVAGTLLFILIGLIVFGLIGALINAGLLAFMTVLTDYTDGFWALYPAALGIMVGVIGLAMAAKIGVGSTPDITVERT